MRNTLLATAALALAISSGAAFAQTAATDGEPGGNPPVIQNPVAGLGGFYNDDAMTELRTPEENREMFMAMPADQQQSVRAQCEAAAAADPSVEVGEETTGSIEPGVLPPTIGALCQQMSTFQ